MPQSEADDIDEVAPANDEAIWGDRANSLVGAMGVMSRPIHMASLVAYAQRKGWEVATLAGVIAYCERTGQVVRFKAFNGEKAFRLAGDADAPVDEDDAEEERHAAPAHLEEDEVAKDAITADEAAEMLDVNKESIGYLCRLGRIERLSGGKGKPGTFSRASVITYRDRKHKTKAATDHLPATRTKRKASASKKSTAIVPRVVQLRERKVEQLDVEGLRLLVSCVDRGWIDQDAAWAKLRELVAEL